MKPLPSQRQLTPLARRQRGVVLLFSLIALVVMLIVAVALVRSFNSSLFTAGNIGFKRDLQNQNERAVNKVLAEFRSGGSLSTAAGRSNANVGQNYSPMMLSSNAQGIPDALQNDTTFAAFGSTSNDIRPPETATGVTIRYVVDRLCVSAGSETTLGPSACIPADTPTPAGTSLLNLRSAERKLTASGTPTTPRSVVYRISIRVIGPRNTQSFFQTTFTVPS